MDEGCTQNPLCEIAKTRFCELEKRLTGRIESLEKSIDKAESILRERLLEMNEFRAQIQKERTDFTTRRETILLNFIISIVVLGLGGMITYLVMGN